jgi:hypothetical protein
MMLNMCFPMAGFHQEPLPHIPFDVELVHVTLILDFPA